MGNNPQVIHNVTNCVQYSGSSFNIHQLELNSELPILCSYYSNSSLYFITEDRIECFTNTIKSHDYLLSPGQTVTAYYLSEKEVYLAESSGKIKILDINSLQVLQQITPSKLLPGIICCLQEAYGFVYAGHISGDLTV